MRYKGYGMSIPFPYPTLSVLLYNKVQQISETFSEIKILIMYPLGLLDLAFSCGDYGDLLGCVIV
jgi:hypothetical protein